MELMIYNPEGALRLPEIEWNYEELKKYALVKSAEYQSIAYTDADVADMKKDRADINRFITALESARKDKKKEYLAPYEKFEAQVKDALAPLRQTSVLIGQKLDEVEQQYRAGRREKMQEYYQEFVGDLRSIIPFDKTVKDEYYKKSFSDKKLKQAYMDFFDRIQDELRALDELPERFRDKAVLKYAETFSLSDALREGKRLEELEKVMEERRKKQEEERKAETAREAERQAVLRPQAPAVNVPAEQKPDDKKAETAETERKMPENPVLHLDFRAWGTREQLMGLRQYMIDHGIKFGKVE